MTTTSEVRSQVVITGRSRRWKERCSWIMKKSELEPTAVGQFCGGEKRKISSPSTDKHGDHSALANVLHTPGQPLRPHLHLRRISSTANEYSWIISPTFWGLYKNWGAGWGNKVWSLTTGPAFVRDTDLKDKVEGFWRRETRETILTWGRPCLISLLIHHSSRPTLIEGVYPCLLHVVVVQLDDLSLLWAFVSLHHPPGWLIWWTIGYFQYEVIVCVFVRAACVRACVWERGRYMEAPES